MLMDVEITMKALTFLKPGEISFSDVEDPRLVSEDHAIVRVTMTAVCGSDLHIYRGTETGIDPGTVMGHEFIGEVIEVGSTIEKLSVGDRVFSPFFTHCGECERCDTMLACRCTRGNLYGWVEGGKGIHGAQAEYVTVPLADSTLVKIPENITDEEALLLCDVFPTGFFGAEMSEPNQNKNGLVIGCGPVGLMAVIGLRELGAGQVYAVDPIKERRELANRFGAKAMHPDEFKLLKTLPHSIVEAVGSPGAQKYAYDVISPGGTLAVVGVHNEPQFSFSPNDLYNKNLTYRTGRCPVPKFFPKLIPLAQEKKYPLASIISHRLPLQEGPRAYDIFDRKTENCTKALLRP